MIIPAKHVVTNANLSLIIRPAELNDAQSLLELKRSYIEESKTIPMDLVEYGASIEREIELIDTFIKSTNSLLLVAEKDGILIGNIDLSGNPRKIMQHTGMIGMGIVKDYRGKGVGSILMEVLINQINQHSTIKVVWLEVYATNLYGIKLYEKMGFNQSGIIPNFFYQDETYIDKITMYKSIG